MTTKPLLFIAVLLLTLAGCTPIANHTTPVAKITAPPAPSSSDTRPYRIGVGDELELKFFFTPELNDRLTVRPDGKISIMFAQDIQAAGRTPQELADLIKHKLSKHVKQLDLVVIVRTFASQKVYVGGEVGKPGPVMLTGRENLLQVINDAGWVTPYASHDKLMLVRRDAKGRDVIYPIDFSDLMNGEDMSQNLLVQAGDIVLVPPSGATALDRWVDQNLRQAVPFSMGVVVNRGVGP